MNITGKRTGGDPGPSLLAQAVDTQGWLYYAGFTRVAGRGAPDQPDYNTQLISEIENN